MPGRARFRVPGLYHCPAAKHAIERELALRHQIERVSANPLTGNVLVEFDKQIDPQRIAALLQEIVRGGGDLWPNSSSAELSLLCPRGVAIGRTGTSRRRGNLPAPLVGEEFASSGENGWHRRDVRAVAAHLGSSKNGLPEQVAADRLAACGPNRLPELEARSG